MNKHGKPKKLKQQKKKKERHWKQHNKKQDLARSYHEALVSEISPILPDVPEGIVCDILSRLPVKSLMRFKCVCKQWQSLIHKDQSFIDLHFSRSKTTRPVSLLCMGELKRKFDDINCMMSMELFLSSDDGLVVAAVGRMSRWKYPFPKEYWRCVFRTTNGLLCVLNRIDYSVCVYNISTRESTPWIKSTFIKKQQDKKQDFSLSMFDLGYDPVTKEHKVIAVWSYKATNELVCEVLTVGQNTWRRIDASGRPLSEMYHLFGYNIVKSVHVNGLICWLDFHHRCEESCLIQFHVGSEKFTKTKILLPNLNFNNFSLIDIDSRLAMLSVDYSTAKMYILCEQDNGSKTTTSSAASSPTCDYYWMEEIFSKPPFDCEAKWGHIHQYIHIPGTDLFMVRCNDHKKSFDYYNWKKKSYGSCRIPLGITSSFGDVREVIFTPSLFPVN
ncbi:hypothetical protein MKW92_003817 [Papaver armeniacum]|nr:hypothetical protein MKW92_003817 [Papaver armeniacum]